MRAVGNVILKVDTSSTSTPSFVDLEKVQIGLTMGGSTDTFSMDSLDNVSGFKLVAPGDSDYEISGSYIMTGVTTVNGWKAGSAVLRPAGFAGVVKYSSLDELRMVQGEQGVAIAYLEGGKVGIFCYSPC